MAGLYRCVRECARFIEELKDSLDATEVEKLRDDCEALGVGDWDDWFFAHLDDIRAFVAASPDGRKKSGRWGEPDLRRRLVLASIQQTTRACNLLDGIHSHGISPGQSCRQLASRAADAYLDIFLKQPASDWPFGGPDPFEQR